MFMTFAMPKNCHYLIALHLFLVYNILMIYILRNGYNNETLFYIVALIIAILASISIHEFAHAYVAFKNGDDTAKRMGRYTLNPIAHLDIFGSISFLLFGFGWAKPVPINPLRFKYYRKGIFLTSIAGIISNIFTAFFCAGFYILFLKISPYATSDFANFIVTFLTIFFKLMFSLNLGLAIFNLLPIFPLDGFNIIYSLSKSENKFLLFMQKYGSFILLALFLTNYFDIGISYLANLIGTPFVNFWDYVLVI